MNRILSVTRMQLVTWPSSFGWPWGILLSSFLVNLVVFFAIGDNIEGGPKTGGVLSIYVVVLIGASQSITQFFPLSLGLSVTRRTFYLTTALLLVAESLVFGVLLYLLKLLESATDGWGISLPFFGLPFANDDNLLLQILIYAVPFTVFGFIGICSSLVYTRWRLNGLFTLLVASLVVLGALVAFITWQRDWPAIGHWLTNASALSLFAGWPALLALVLAGLGWLTIRRATP
jgi:hypothetical protein